MLYMAVIKELRLNHTIAEVTVKHPRSKPNAHQLKALCEYIMSYDYRG